MLASSNWHSVVAVSMARSMYASSFHIGKKTLSFEKGVARSAAIGARVAGAPPASPVARYGASDGSRSPHAGRAGDDVSASATTFAQRSARPLSWHRGCNLRRPASSRPMWRLAFGLGWAAIVVCYAAIWESSRVIGLSTWWLGADAEPRMLLIQLLPFYGPILVTVAAISNWRYVPYLGIVVGLAGAAIGVGDLGRVRWIATVELVLAGVGGVHQRGVARRHVPPGSDSR